MAQPVDRFGFNFNAGCGRGRDADSGSARRRRSVKTGAISRRFIWDRPDGRGLRVVRFRLCHHVDVSGGHCPAHGRNTRARTMDLDTVRARRDPVGYDLGPARRTDRCHECLCRGMHCRGRWRCRQRRMGDDHRRVLFGVAAGRNVHGPDGARIHRGPGPVRRESPSGLRAHDREFRHWSDGGADAGWLSFRTAWGFSRGVPDRGRSTHCRSGTRCPDILSWIVAADAGAPEVFTAPRTALDRGGRTARR